jgi:hypothetical protein
MIGGTAQVVECLSSKCKALSPALSTENKTHEQWEKPFLAILDKLNSKQVMFVFLHQLLGTGSWMAFPQTLPLAIFVALGV